MNRTAAFISAVSLAALAGCGAVQGKRSELAEREIEQCVAGLAGLIPDDEQRKTVCECTADAKFNPQLSGKAMADAVHQCRDKAAWTRTIRSIFSRMTAAKSRARRLLFIRDRCRRNPTEIHYRRIYSRDGAVTLNSLGVEGYVEFFECFCKPTWAG